MSTLALLIPARNAERVLGRLLDSARAQTRPFDEIVLYDDASTDGTGDLARGRGVRVVRSDVNTGPSAGKNRLAAETPCEWVHFHDADEALGPEFVERAHRWMAEPDVDVVLFDTEERDDATGRYMGRAAWNDAALQHDAVRYNIVHTVTNCGVYRRAPFVAAGGFDLDEAVKYNEDQAMHLRLALAGLHFRAESYTGVIVYRRENSMSSGHPIECVRAQVDVLQRVADRTGSTYAQEIGARVWRLAGVCAAHDDWSYVSRCLRLAEQVAYSTPDGEHWGMRLLARVSPIGALRAREHLIRIVKPGLRAGMPRVDVSQQA
jgi:glycosyltransferase involved in cell wall biosynthesis